MKVIALYLAPLFFCLTGCSLSVQTVRIKGIELSATSGNHEMVVIPNDQTEPPNCQVIGKVFMQKNGNGTDPIRDEAIVKKLKESAQAMGGEMLVGLQYSNYCGLYPSHFTKWASALVGKNVTPGSDIKKTNIGVAILQPVNSSTDVDSATKAEEDMIVVKTSQYYLEKAGYYAWVAKAENSIIMNAIQNNQLNGLDSVGGRNATYILLIEGGIKGAAHNVGASATGQLRSYLFSKESKSIVWQNSLSKSTSWKPSLTPGGLNPIFSLFDNARTEALYKSLKELYEKLTPPANTVISK